MSWVAQHYSDISPVTLQVGGAMSSTLYCQQVEGLAQAESFLVEIFRCKVCQFTCGLKAAIGSHLLLRHHSPPLTCLTGPDGPQVSQEGAEPEPPYGLSLDGESKQSDADEDFLLYDMLGGMSPPTCDISTEEGLQVAHTCEVSSLFEEPSMFPLKVAPLSSPSASPSSEDQSAQSAHLRTLGLCRISSVRPPPGRRPCPLCPLTLPSQRLLDVQVGSRRTADGWEALEPPCRRRCRRGRRSRRSRSGGATAAQDADWPSDTWREGLTEPQEPERAELPDSRPSPIGRPLKLPGPTANQEAACEASSSVSSLTSSSQSGSPQVVSPIRNQEQTGLTCSLCHRTLSSKLTLRRHLGVHGEDRPFSCPHCPYSSRLKASLRQHLRTHTGEKPFRCAECPYASIDRSSLLRHSRTHSQVKPYRCQLCGYSSIQKKSLDLHARRHHTGEAFPCQQCEYSSPDRQLLLKHMRRRHAPSLLPAI